MIATSTVAFTAYNALVLLGQPSTMTEIAKFSATNMQYPLPKEQLVEALDELVLRKRVHRMSRRFMALGPPRALLKTRSRAGEGWDAWVIEIPQRGRALLDEVIR